MIKDIRINSASLKSQSNTHKLKWVLFLIVDYDTCFLCLSPPFSLLIFVFFAFFIYAYTTPTWFDKFSLLLVFNFQEANGMVL